MFERIIIVIKQNAAVLKGVTNALIRDKKFCSSITLNNVAMRKNVKINTLAAKETAQ